MSILKSVRSFCTRFVLPALVIAATTQKCWAIEVPILPLVKPPVISSGAIIIPAKVLPEKKPPYYGPFGQDYTYLLSVNDRDLFRRALVAVKDRKWKTARAQIRNIEHPLPAIILDWMYMREPGSHVSMRARIAFIRTHPDWPSMKQLIRQTEGSVDNSLSDLEVVQWFNEHPPVTADGKIGMANALKDLGQEQSAAEVIRDAWINGTFTRSTERRFLRQYNTFVSTTEHLARLNRLLWDRHTNSARRMIKRVDNANQALGEARIALINSAYGVDRAISRVPESLRSDPGLTYDRIRWRRVRGRLDSARELLRSDSINLIRPALWWLERHILARDALASGFPNLAYSIASNHGQTSNLGLSEGEWLAGWISLRFLFDPYQAEQHFRRVYDVVQFPVSLSRGAYWVGRSIDAQGDNKHARNWYRKAALHNTTYYGQLALARLANEPTPQLPLNPMPTITERSAFHQRKLAQAVRIAAETGADDLMRPFVLSLADSSDFSSGKHLAAELAIRLQRPDLGVWVARYAAQQKVILVETGYPIPSYSLPTDPEKALTLGVIRQESNFDVTARSRAGALGLMQLMPRTARHVARSNRLRYNRSRLTSEPDFNIELGTSYLRNLLKQFRGSYVLSIAGYNAGPDRSWRWIRAFGDPRDEDVDAVDWVEHIPFSETRNYVQRVMENVMVYRSVLQESQEMAQTLELDLSR